MQIDMDAAAKQVFDTLAPILPDFPEYMVWVEPDTDSIMVGTVEHRFALSRAEVEDNTHIRLAKMLLPDLIAKVGAGLPEAPPG